MRLDTYRFDEDDMAAALDRVMGDEALRARVATAGERIRAADGVRRAADLIEGVGLSRRS
ncbi:hypothetical protein BH24CHL9_BH24CHL9_11290 [soil metagenome]